MGTDPLALDAVAVKMIGLDIKDLPIFQPRSKESSENLPRQN
jgi:hypothetical protein